MHSPKEHLYAVYMMASKTGTIYTGMTNNLYVRVGQHKAEEIEGFSKRYHCTRLVYYERYDFVQIAEARETQLKGWSRSKKVALIESVNPRWRDLAENWGKELLFKNQSMADADVQASKRIKLAK